MKRVYKDLLRLARRFDSHPCSKVLIYRNSLQPLSSSYASVYYNDLLDQFLEKKNLYLPTEGPSLTDTVMYNFRRDPIGREEAALRLDTAFSIYRKLNSIWQCYSSIEFAYGENTPYVSPVSLASALGLSTSKVSSLPSVRLSHSLVSGTILVAHPLIQGPMHRSCILVLENSSKGIRNESFLVAMQR